MVLAGAIGSVFFKKSDVAKAQLFSSKRILFGHYKSASVDVSKKQSNSFGDINQNAYFRHVSFF
jgi:hypothetical protein